MPNSSVWLYSNRTYLKGSLVNGVFGVLACSRDWCACVLTWFRACVLGVLTCSRAWHPCKLVCLRAYVLPMLVCLCAWVLVMMKCFIFLRVCVLGALFCLIYFTSQYFNLKILTAKICVLCSVEHISYLHSDTNL